MIGHGLLAVVLAASLGLAGCRSAPTVDADRDRAGEAVRVATEAAFPPFNEAGLDGEPRGFEIDLVRRLAEGAGLGVEFVVEREFAQLFRLIDRGEADVIASTVGVTPQRRQRYLFTRPYFITGIAVVVRAGDERFREPEDIAARRVGVPAGTTSAEVARELTAAEVHEYRTSGAAIADLIEREIDAYVIDLVEARQLVARDPERLRMLDDLAAAESYALLVSPARPELRDRLDRQLQILQRSGVLASLQESYSLDP